VALHPIHDDADVVDVLGRLAPALGLG
jgi:hypothetical protein